MAPVTLLGLQKVAGLLRWHGGTEPGARRPGGSALPRE